MNAEAKTLEQQPAPVAQPVESNQPMEVYSNKSNFELAQRIAKALSESSLVPTEYRQNVPNCLIALEMANRIGCSPLFVAQNLYVIQGRPSWSSTFIIASINSCKRFSPLRFEVTGEGMQRQCVAWAVELRTGERLESPIVSMAMAKAEGWYDKNGSKWKTMPDLMLRYRSAAFFGRLYAPEMLLGMQAAEEVQDVIDVTPQRGEAATGVAGAKALLEPAAEAAS